MKKYLLFLLCTGLLSICLHAQRCLPKQVGLAVKVGLVDGFRLNPYGKEFGWYTQVDASFYTRHKSHWEAGVSFLEKRYRYKRGDIPVMQFTAVGGYHFTFLSDRSTTFLLSIGATGVLGYEWVNRGEERAYDGSLIKHKSAFVYGGAVSLEAGIYCTDTVVLLFTLCQRILAGSTVGPFHTQIGTGIRIIIH